MITSRKNKESMHSKSCVQSVQKVMATPIDWLQVEKDDYFSKDLLTNVFDIEEQKIIGNELVANSKGTNVRVINDDVLNWMPLTSKDSKLFWTQFECTRSAQSRIGDSDVEGQRRKAIAIGNIPYNITKPLLQLILPRSDLFSEVILREFSLIIFC